MPPSLAYLLLLGAALAGPPAAPASQASTPATTTADAEIVSERILVHLTRDGSASESGERSVLLRTEAGLGEAAFVLPVLPYTEVVRVTGSLDLPDGRKVPLEPKDILERPYLSGAQVASDVRLLVATFPRAVPGSTFHVSWERSVAAPLYLSDWTFRGRLPIRHSVFKVTSAPGISVAFQQWNGSVEPTTETTADQGTTYTFEVKDRTAVVEEPYSPRLARRESVVEIKVKKSRYGTASIDTGDWGGIASFYSDLAADRYALDPATRDELRALARKLKDPRAILANLEERVRRYRYVQLYLGMGGYQPHAAVWTMKRGYGDCKDLATVYVAMARAAGLDAYPMLTSVSGGRGFEAAYPSPRQFDHCVAYVNLPGGPVIVDATAPVYPLGELPGALAGAQALVVSPTLGAKPFLLPGGDPAASTTAIDVALASSTFVGAGSGSGAATGLTGTLHARLTGDARVRALHVSARKAPELDAEAVELALAGALKGTRLTEPRWTDDGTTMVLEGTIAGGRFVPHAGAERLVAPALFLEEPRAAAFASAERETPVDLGVVGTRRLRIHAPAGAPSSCPAPVSVESPYGTYTLSCSQEGGAGVLDRTLVVAKTWIDLEEYPAARRFWQSVVAGDRSALTFHDEAAVADSGTPRGTR